MKRRCVLPIALFLIGLVSSSPGAAVPPPEKLLPAETLFVLTVPDYKKSSGQWSQWPSSRLWRDPSMKPFREKFVNKLKSDLIEPLEKELGMKLSDFESLAQGQVTLAVTANGWGGAQASATPALLLLLDAREQSGVLKSNLTTLKTRWVDSGKQVRVDKIRDIEFTTLLIKPDEVKKSMKKVFPDPNDANESLEPPKPDRPGRTVELLLGQSDTLLVAGTSAKDIERVLVNQSGGSAGSLADQAQFAASYQSLFRESVGYGWINTKAIIDTLVKLAGKEEEGRQNQGFRPDKVISAIGLAGLESVGFNLRDLGEGWMSELSLRVPESSRRGLFKAFAFEAKDANPPPFVPADAVKFYRLRLDLAKAANIVESTATEAVPQIAGFVKLVLDNAGKDKDPNFDLRKNLIANLGDDVIAYEKAPKKLTLADLGSPPSLYLVGSARAEQVAAAIKALGAVMPQPKVKEREFLGRQVYALNLPPAQGPGGKPIERVLHYTASGGYVALSTDVSLLEEFMRSSDSAAKALRDTPGLSQAAQKVGGMATGFFGYENQLETARATVETLKKESGTLANLFNGTPLAGRFGDGASKFKDWVDFSLLPSFDQIAKYFSINVWSGNVTSDAFSFKLYSPNPQSK